MGIHATTQHALLYGVLAATAFSGALGLYRRGLAAGLILGICAGALILVVTNPLQTLLTVQPGTGNPSLPGFNSVASVGTAEDSYDQTSQAYALGILAGCVFSGIVGSYRCGLVIGVFLAVCTGAVLLAATMPLWLTLLSIMPSLT